MIQTETTRAAQVKARLLRDYSIKVVDEWLTGCVSFSLQENPKASNDALFVFAYEQWKLADLVEVGVPSLPATVEGKQCFTLNGTFPLQLNYLMDISEPCYDQLRNLYNKKLDEADDEVQMRRNQAQHVKKKRMLKLELTDGRRTVIGMEHSPIAVLNTKLSPGIKVLLSGPIRCINAVLFLEPKNIRVLGGEVDTLLITNAFENILLKALKKPLNPNPKTEYDEVVVDEKSRTAGNHRNIPSVPMVFHSPAKPVGNRPSNDDWDDDDFLGINLDGIEGACKNEQQNPPEQVPTVSTLMDDDDDLEIINIPEEEIMHQQVSSTKTSQPSPPAPPATRKPPFRMPTFDDPDDDIDALNSIENEIRQEQYPEPPATPPATTTVTPVQQAKRPRLASAESPPRPSITVVEDDQRPGTSKNFDKCSVSALFEGSLDGSDFEQNLHALSGGRDNILSPQYQFRIEGHSLATLSQVNLLSDADRTDRTLVVFGEVDSVIEQIRVKNDGWKLSVKISDRSDRFLAVRLHTAVISKMVGYEATEIQAMKKAKVLKLLEEILTKFKNQLQELRTFMRVRYNQGNDFPYVMELYEATPDRWAILSEKIKKENATHLLEYLPPGL